MKKLNLLVAVALLVTLLFTACEQEAVVEPDQIVTDEVALKIEADEIIAELSNHVSLDGFKFMNPAEYAKIPVADVTKLPNLLEEDAVTTRSGYVKLPTPPVVNQGIEGSCVSFAVGYVGVSYYLHRRKGMPYTTSGAYRSPEFLYNNTKATGSDCQAATYFQPVLNFLRNTGVCSWSQMPYSSTNGCSTRGGNTQISQAQSGRIKSWQQVTKSTSAIRSLVERGYPVLTGFQMDDQFLVQTKSANTGYTWRTKGGTRRGGHAVAIVGYDDSRRIFIAQNSWGTNTHDRGYFYISYDLISSLALELFIIDPTI